MRQLVHLPAAFRLQALPDCRMATVAQGTSLTDVEDESEPQSGADGGAVGGTPANKRSSSR